MSIDNVAYDLKRILQRRASVQVRIANTALPEEVIVTSITDDGAGTATVVATAHGYTSTNDITIYGAYESRFNGTFEVTVTDANTFTFTVAGTTAGTATGTVAAVKGTTLAGTDIFYNLGVIRDASVTSDAVKTSPTTTGAEHHIGSNFKIELTMAQTGDVEFAALEELCTNGIDVAVFNNPCASGVTDTAVIIPALENGFLVYDVLPSVSGQLLLDGGENGMIVSFPFYVGRDMTGIVIGV